MDYFIDAKNKRLGRLASEIAILLQGKQHPSYEPRLLGNDRVMVKNITSLTVGGKKFFDKIYYHHTGYPGALKERSYREVFAKNPRWVLQHAVRLMLPKNRLRAKRLRRLVIEK